MANVESPTNRTTRLVLQFLFSARIFAWRENVLPVPMVRKGLLTGFRGGSKQGKPDIMGIIPAGLLPGSGELYGVPLEIEVKTGPDRLRPEQIGFLATATKMGAVVLVIKDFEDFKLQWEKLMYKIPIQRIEVCKNCPSLGNHVHIEGELVLVEDGKSFIEVAQIEGNKVAARWQA